MAEAGLSELVCQRCGWQGTSAQAVCWRQPYGNGSEWHLRADCGRCLTFIKYLPRDEHVALVAPSLMELGLLARRAALDPRAAELEEWAGRQVPRLRTWLAEDRAPR